MAVCRKAPGGTANSELFVGLSVITFHAVKVLWEPVRTIMTLAAVKDSLEVNQSIPLDMKNSRRSNTRYTLHLLSGWHSVQGIIQKNLEGKLEGNSEEISKFTEEFVWIQKELLHCKWSQSQWDQDIVTEYLRTQRVYKWSLWVIFIRWISDIYVLIIPRPGLIPVPLMQTYEEVRAMQYTLLSPMICLLHNYIQHLVCCENEQDSLTVLGRILLCIFVFNLGQHWGWCYAFRALRVENSSQIQYLF